MARVINIKKIKIVAVGGADMFRWLAPPGGWRVHGVSFPNYVRIKQVHVGPQMVATCEDIALDPVYKLQWLNGDRLNWVAEGELLVPAGICLTVRLWEASPGATLLFHVGDEAPVSARAAASAPPAEPPALMTLMPESARRAELRARQRQECLDVLKTPYMRKMYIMKERKR